MRRVLLRPLVCPSNRRVLRRPRGRNVFQLRPRDAPLRRPRCGRCGGWPPAASKASSRCPLARSCGTTTATSALKDDIVNRAEVQNKQANAAKMFADGGWEPDSIIDALDADDLARLVHSGLPTVQVQAPAAGLPAPNGDQPALEPAEAGRSV